MAIDWVKIATPGSRLLTAQQKAAASGPGIDSLNLRPLRDGVPAVNVAGRIVTARALLTMDGASTLTIGLHDPEWLIEASGVLDTDADGRMNAMEVWLDTLAFRLAKASRTDPETLELTFEDRAWSLLKEHDSPLSLSRGAMTRAQFIERMVREVRAIYIPFYSPEKGRRMPTERPDYPSAAPAHGSTGFDSGASFKIKGVRADAGQMREVATAMTVADQEGVTDRPRLAMLVAGIGESGFRDIPNSEGSPYGGVFQALKTRHLSTEQQARDFLRGGQGFQSGGAIRLARSNPTLSIGAIATAVEAGGAAPSFYGQWEDEAKAIAQAWNPGDQTSASGHDVLRVKSFHFTRGQPGKTETTVDAAQRLASEVDWRFYCAGGVASFNRDDFVMTNPASLVINGPSDPRLIERPLYDVDHGKVAQTAELHLRLQRWELSPGDVVVLTQRAFGGIRGRWLTLSLDINLLDENDNVLMLTKPLGARKEPAPELIASSPGTGGGGTGAPASGGAQTAITWATDKIGHFKEEWGANRGSELDKLEKSFGFTSGPGQEGAPWCAMFATTAVAQAVGDQCKTAAVSQIRQWCAEGSHGYLKGFRKTPQPGDLMCFGTAHVALVVKVSSGGSSVTTIEGNTSAGKVATLTRLTDTGDLVRPDYVTS